MSFRDCSMLDNATFRTPYPLVTDGMVMDEIRKGPEALAYCLRKQIYTIFLNKIRGKR